MNGRNKKIIDSLRGVAERNKENQESNSDKSTQVSSSNSESAQNNADATSLENFLSSNKSSSSNESNVNSNDSNQSGSSNSSNDNQDVEDMEADAQLKKLEQSSNDTSTDSKSKNENNNINSQSDDADKNAQQQLQKAKQDYQPTSDAQDEQSDEAQLDSLKASTSNVENTDKNTTNDAPISSSSNSGTIKASDPATTKQGQKNLEKNEAQHQPDLQNITSPNLFIVRARNFHNKMTHLLDKYAYTKDINADIINYIISLEDESFNNLCNGFSLIIEDNNRRNNEIEARTEHLQKQASNGAKTIQIWQNEGIFANLKDEIGELSDVIHDQRFKAFAQKTKTADLNVPKTLKVKGKEASENVKKNEAQQKQSKGGNK